MEISMRKGMSLEILLTTFMILLNTSPSESKSISVLMKHFHGLNNVTIADRMEFEFLHGSNIERMLADGSESFITLNALIANEAVLRTCGRGKPYHSCLPPANPKPKPDMCSIYNRVCPKPS